VRPGAIILGVTNLDLFSALVVIDRAGAMDGDKFDWLAAEKKLQMLLDTMTVPAGIPAKYSDLEVIRSASAKAVTRLSALARLLLLPNGRLRRTLLRRKHVSLRPNY